MLITFSLMLQVPAGRGGWVKQKNQTLSNTALLHVGCHGWHATVKSFRCQCAVQLQCKEPQCQSNPIIAEPPKSCLPPAKWSASAPSPHLQQGSCSHAAEHCCCGCEEAALCSCCAAPLFAVLRALWGVCQSSQAGSTTQSAAHAASAHGTVVHATRRQLVALHIEGDDRCVDAVVLGASTHCKQELHSLVGTVLGNLQQQCSSNSSNAKAAAPESSAHRVVVQLQSIHHQIPFCFACRTKTLQCHLLDTHQLKKVQGFSPAAANCC